MRPNISYIFKAPYSLEKLQKVRQSMNDQFGGHHLAFYKSTQIVESEGEALNTRLQFGTDKLIDHYKKGYGTVTLPHDTRQREALLDELNQYEIERPDFKTGAVFFIVYTLVTLFFALKSYYGAAEGNSVAVVVRMFGPIGLAVGLGMLYLSLKGRRRAILRIASFFVMLVTLFMTTPHLMIPLVVILLLPILTAISRTELIGVLERHQQKKSGKSAH